MWIKGSLRTTCYTNSVNTLTNSVQEAVTTESLSGDMQFSLRSLGGSTAGTSGDYITNTGTSYAYWILPLISSNITTQEYLTDLWNEADVSAHNDPYRWPNDRDPSFSMEFGNSGALVAELIDGNSIARNASSTCQISLNPPSYRISITD